MSWGERSCTHYQEPCLHNPEPHTCNVECCFYNWDKHTVPDSTNPAQRARLAKAAVIPVGPMKPRQSKMPLFAGRPLVEQ